MILIRVDSSYEIGYGHLYRMLEIAEQLIKLDCEVLFVCRELEGDQSDRIISLGFNLLRLPSAIKKNDDKLTPHSSWLTVSQQEDAEQTVRYVTRAIGKKEVKWLLQDHFSLAKAWQEVIVESLGCKLFVMDGLADREHICDVLVDPNWVHERYHWLPLITKHCQLFLGPDNIKFKDSFLKIGSRRRTQKVDNSLVILITFGGVDKVNATMQCLNTLAPLLVNEQFSVEVIVGAGYQHMDGLRDVVSRYPLVTIHHDTNMVAEIVNRADLAVGAAGTMAWERLAQGLPTLHYCVAHNQLDLSKSLAERGVAIDMGNINNFSEKALLDQVIAIKSSPELLTNMSDKCLSYGLLKKSVPQWIDYLLEEKKLYG